MAQNTISLEVTTDHAVPVEPLGGTATVLNVSGDTLYFADTSQVSAANNQGSLTAGQSHAFAAPAWVVSAGLSTVTVTVTFTSFSSNSGITSGDVAVVNGVSTVNTVKSGQDPVVNVTLAPFTTWFDAIQNAINVATSDLTAHTTLQLPWGNLDLTKAAGSGIQIPANITGFLAIRGAGRGTCLQLATSVPSAFKNATTVAGDTFGNFSISNLMVDSRNATGNGLGVLLHVNMTDGNVSNVTVEDFEVRNVGGLSASNNRRCVHINVTTSVQFSATQYTITDVTVRRFICGAIGGGGNTGILVQAFGGSDSHNTLYYGATPGTAPTVTKANVWLDRITIEDGYWTSGAIPTTSLGSAGVQVGADGLCGTVNIRRVYCQGSGDVNFELDSVLDLHVVDCVGVDALNEDFFLANNHGGLPEALLERQVARFTRCLARRTQSSLASCAGFFANSLHGSAFGHVIFDDCAFECTAPDFRTTGGAFINPNFALQVYANFRKCSIRNFRISYPSLAITALANSQTLTNLGVGIRQQGGEGVLEIRGMHMELTGTGDNTTFTGAALQNSAVKISSCTRLYLDVDGISVKTNVTPLNGYATRFREFEISGTSNVTDGWATAGTLTGDYIVDAGALSDLLQTGGVVTSVANHTTRKLLRAPMLSANINTGSTNQIGKNSDAAAYAEMVTDATTNMTGAELIARLRVADSGTTELRAILDSTGVRIEKVVGGTVTALLAAQAVTQPTAGQKIGLRLRQVGTLLTADYFLAPAGVPSLTTTVTSTFTFTLVGGDVAAFVTGPLGFVGWGWTPGASGATFTTFRYDRLQVIAGGVVRGLRPIRNLVIPTQGNGFLNSASTGQARLEGPLRVSFVRTGVIADGGAQGDVSLGSDANVTNFVFVEPGSAWAQPPSGAAITVTASPFTYKNSNPYPVRVGVFGGTVSSITITDAGGTARQVAAATNVALSPLQTGESMVVTYTVAPTMNYVPVL